MSGPKVVRIVTREEIEATCRQHIQMVEQAISELRNRARRFDLDDESLKRGIQAHRQNLKDLFEQERWMDIQKQAPQIIAFLQAETANLHAKALAAAEAARSKRRRIIDAARTIISTLERSGRAVPGELQSVISKANAADDQTLAGLQETLNKAFLLVIPTKQTEATEAQHELASRLAHGTTGQTFTEWLAAQPTQRGDREARLDALLAEIEASEPPAVAEQFISRAGAIHGESSPERRALLTDSLILDASERARVRRQLEEASGRLKEAKAKLYAGDASLDERVANALSRQHVAEITTLAAEIEELAAREFRELAAAARRRAVLSGLATLGYEVREEMSTAWVREGRLVVRKPGATDFAVELAAPVDATRFQVQLVGSAHPSSPRDAARDRDQEVIWCSEFDRLRNLVAQKGGEIVIERAFEPGAQVMKTVSLPTSEPGETARQSTQVRTFR